MSFPFWSRSLPSAETMFNTLKKQKLYIFTDDDKYNVLERSYFKDYIICDHLSNHFTEYERIKCQFGNYPTPIDVWKKIKNDKNVKNKNPLDQRELVYSNTRECNTFNVTFCLWIINSLVGPGAKILDPSSGWGDRLIAALASEAILYHGFDPNKKLQKGYKSIINTFNTETDASVKPVPFEESIIKNNYYDIAITSPPYFDLEKYGTDPKQSIIKYPSYEEWLTNFYYIYINKMILSVKSGGFIVIYIEDITSNGTKYNMREYTVKTMNESGKVTFYTKMGLKVGKAIRYALIFKKL